MMRWFLLITILGLAGVVGCQPKDHSKTEGTSVVLLAPPAPADVPSPAESHPAFLDRLSPECREMLLECVAGFAFDPKRLDDKNTNELWEALANQRVYSDFLNWANTKHPGSNVTETEFVTLLPKHYRAVHAANTLCMQVDNGGLLQFFWNSRNIYNATLVEDLKYIGDDGAAEVMRSAVERCQERNDKMRPGKSGNILQEFADTAATKPYNDLDRRLDTEGLRKRVCSFIQEHRELFCRTSTKQAGPN